MRCTASAEEDTLSPFDSNNVCLCQSIEINNNKHVYRQSQVRKPTGSGVEWTECSLTIGTGWWFKFLAWSSIAQSVCQRAFRLLAIWCLRPWVRILHSAEEDNVSPFDSNIVCLCQSIDICNNKYNKTKLNKTICIFYGIYYVCSNGHNDPYYRFGARFMPVLSLNYSWFLSVGHVALQPFIELLSWNPII